VCRKINLFRKLRCFRTEKGEVKAVRIRGERVNFFKDFVRIFFMDGPEFVMFMKSNEDTGFLTHK